LTELTVLLSCAGRRVELGDIFAKEGYRVVSADAERTAPTLYTASRGLLLPSVSADPGAYAQALLAIVGNEAIDVVVPLIDPELPVLARMYDALRAVGCMANISSVPSVDAASDKAATAGIFRQSGLKAPQTEVIEGVLDSDVNTVSGFQMWPAVLKPRHGSAGRGIIRLPSREAALNTLTLQRYTDYVLQQEVTGDEITMDVLGDGSGRAVSVVQRQRLKIRGGEVERGVTVKIPRLFEDAIALAVVFKPYGVINVQCFYNAHTGERWYTEINARFGGGYPLAYAAGANFPAYLATLVRGETLPSRVGSDYSEGLCMMRYDRAVYMPSTKLVSPSN
jgi:carbamoyl-phosphate synthase large subunit